MCRGVDDIRIYVVAAVCVVIVYMHAYNMYLIDCDWCVFIYMYESIWMILVVDMIYMNEVCVSMSMSTDGEQQGAWCWVV